MSTSTPSAINTLRAVRAVRVPGGESVLIPGGTLVYLTQALGGSFTVQAPHVGGLFRIDGPDADALGLEPETTSASSRKRGVTAEPVTENAIWNCLRGCYDPEIPVNIVDLGLIYDLSISPDPAGGSRVGVKMTLTAPGCGMGPAIAADARYRIEALPGVTEATVDVIWDPPWSSGMMTKEARKALGLG